MRLAVWCEDVAAGSVCRGPDPATDGWEEGVEVVADSRGMEETVVVGSMWRQSAGVVT